MTTNENLKPLIDRILMNPLQFKQVNVKSDESSDYKLLKNDNYIVIGNKNSVITNDHVKRSNDIDPTNDKFSNDSNKENKIAHPKSMAEALAAYTKKDAKSKKQEKSDAKVNATVVKSENETDAKTDSKETEVSSDKNKETLSSGTSSDQEFHEAKEFISSDESASGLEDDMSDLSDDYEGNESESIGNHIDENISKTVSSLKNEQNKFEANEDDEDIGEDIGEDLGEDIGEDISQDIGKDLEQNINKDVNDNVNENSDEEMDETTNEDVSLEVPQNSDKSVSQDISETLLALKKQDDVENDDGDDSNADDYNEDDASNDDDDDASFNSHEDKSENVSQANSDIEMSDNDDEISQISDSERIGLLEESIKFEKDRKTISTTESNQNDNNDEREEVEELKHKISQYKKKDESNKIDNDLKNFYQYNEMETDEGSILPSRIIKNWGKEMSKLKTRGLLNHGVTCYTNAAVQAMLHIPAVQHYLWDILRNKYSDIISPNSVTTTLAETSKRMWFPNDKLKKKLNSYIDPNKLINRLDDINCMMSEWQQEDSHEYFMSLMSRLQEDSVPKGHKMTESMIYDIFGGLLKQTVTCKSCGGVSKTEQPFYDLSLHLKGKKKLGSSANNDSNDNSSNSNNGSSNINERTNSSNSKDNTSDNETSNNKDNKDNKNNTSNANDELSAVNRRFSIEKSINDFFNPELIKVDNDQKGYICEKCHKTTNAVKRNTIIRAPETLPIHLKKFRFNGSQSSKMKQAVSYPMFLNMTQYCEKTDNLLPVKYQLISVVVHEGRSLSSGHYITHCKQPDGTWATYDDEYINKISEKDVLRESNAYYLIYTRLTPKEITLRKQLPKEKVIGLPIDKRSNNNSNNSNNSNRNGNGNSGGSKNRNKKKNKNKKRKFNKN